MMSSNVPTNQMTVNEVLQHSDLEMPGSNTALTMLLIVLQLVLLILVSQNPLLSHDVVEVQKYHGGSILCVILSGGIALGSIAFISKFLNLEFRLVSRYQSLFYGKMLVSISVLMMFCLICFWVVLLGGILKSPFATLLTISPILFHIQTLSSKQIDFDRIRSVLEEFGGAPDKRRVKVQLIWTRWVLWLLDTLPILIVFLTVSIGEMAVSRYGIADYLIGGKQEQISQTTWYTRLYYSTFYSSLLSALAGVVPRRIYQQISQRFLVFL